MWVSTFHSTCVRILRNQASLIDGPQLQLLHLRRRRFATPAADDRQGHGAGHQAVLAAAAGQRHLQPEERADRPASRRRPICPTTSPTTWPASSPRVYAEYQRRLRAANALDFDDLIGETVAVLQAFPQIAQYYRRRFRHVLVDEYQDTNHAQYVLVRELVGRDAADAGDRGRGAAGRAVRGRRRRPVDLRVPRRHHPQHRGLRTRLPERRQRFCWNRITAPRRTSCRRPTR